jgi:hypothetical protein
MPLFTHSPGDLDELVHLSWKSIRNLGGKREESVGGREEGSVAVTGGVLRQSRGGSGETSVVEGCCC